MESIIIENLSKCYRISRRRGGSGFSKKQNTTEHLTREIWALKNISLIVKKGTVLGIIGRNGAGKTTLLKVLTRITPPTKGQAIVRGRVVSLLELGVGFQPELTALENIFLNGALYGLSRQQVSKHLDDVISFAELEKFADVPVKHYSSGMYLRLAFSTAINMEPDILLADEVLAVGDIGFQNKCIQRMREVGKAGVTVLFVSHDMEAIERLCDYCIRLDEGRIIDSGLPKEVTIRYQNASMNISAQNVTSITKNEEAAILSAKLLSSEMKEIGAIKNTDDVYLKFTYEIFSPNVKVFCSFDIYTNSIHVFRSISTKEYEVKSPGIYSAIARIPKNLLAETIYNVNAGLKITNSDKESFLVSYNALSFRVYNPVVPDFIHGTSRSRIVGIVAPSLEWDFIEHG